MNKTIAERSLCRICNLKGFLCKIERRHCTALLLSLALLPGFELSAHAQAIRFRGGQVRVTVPVNSALSTAITNQVRLSGINSAGASLSISGLPPGATASIDINPAPTNNTPINITINTTNVAQGEYTLSLNGSALDTNGAPVNGYFLFTLQSAHIWNGSTNAVTDGAGDWSDSAKWLGGAPGAGDDVIFNDLGGQTNELFVVPSTSTNYLVNSVISSDLTVGSIRFSQTNSATRAHTIQINPGKTLSITGDKGFRVLRDYVMEIQGLGTTLTNTIVGPGASLVVSNTNAVFALLVDNQQANVLDMSALDNFSGAVKQFSLGDYIYYPNYVNLSLTNAYNGIPRRFLPSVFLARTNVLKAAYVDQYNYTNADDRHFGLSFLSSELSGTSTQPNLYLGISNMFFLDSLNFVGGNQQGNVRFNTAFATNNPIAIFRGTNGGRMAVFTIADAAGSNSISSNVKTPSGIDFASSSGSLDLLADRLYISRDRKLIAGGQNPNYQGFLFMGKGIIEVNTMILGFQENTGQTNTATFNGYCEGTIAATNSGAGTNLIRINGNLMLGYSTQTNPLGLGSGGNTIYGKVALAGSNTTMMVSNVLVGDPIHTSRNNLIVVTNLASLIVSNTVGGYTQSLDTLTYGDGFLTLHLDLSRTDPYVFATNLTTTGSNVIRIASIRNLGALSGNIPLIGYNAGNGSFQGLIMPPGLGGALITTNNVGVYLSILTNSPKDLIWRGYVSQDWNLTEGNWLDRATGLHTNYSNGDRLTFDDDPSTPTTIHLAGPIDLVPGNIAMSNNVNHYIIDSASGGDIQGSATLSEWGSAGVQIDGVTTLTVQLISSIGGGGGGSLTGGGSIGSANVDAGTTMTFAGSIGAGLSVAGTATLSGDCSGTLSLLGTGIVTNAGTYHGPFVTTPGSLLVNNATWLAGGNSIVVSNATMINNGGFHALTLTIGGTLIDTGVGGIYMNGDFVSGTRGLTINNGGIFIPGGDGIATTTIYPELGSVNNFPGRMLFSTGSTNIFKVDPLIPANTMLNSATMGFGPNQNTKAVNGGTIVMTNVSGTAFAAGQSFTMFQYYQGGFLGDAGLNTTNSYPIIIPPAPGPGLVWDLSNLIPNGMISIHSTATSPFDPSFSAGIAFGLVLTNAAATNSFTTNNYVVTHLTWPTNYIGWSLEQQINPINIGLSTNWSQVFGSFWTNEMWFTNVVTTNCAFYRMRYP